MENTPPLWEVSSETHTVCRGGSAGQKLRLARLHFEVAEFVRIEVLLAPLVPAGKKSDLRTAALW